MKYRVSFSTTTRFHVDVEAENVLDAKQAANTNAAIGDVDAIRTKTTTTCVLIDDEDDDDDEDSDLQDEPPHRASGGPQRSLFPFNPDGVSVSPLTLLAQLLTTQN